MLFFPPHYSSYSSSWKYLDHWRWVLEKCITHSGRWPCCIYFLNSFDNLFFYVFIWIPVCTTKCVLALHLFELGKCCVGGIIERDGKYYTLVIFLHEASSEIVTKNFWCHQQNLKGTGLLTVGHWSSCNPVKLDATLGRSFFVLFFFLTLQFSHVSSIFFFIVYKEKHCFYSVNYLMLSTQHLCYERSHISYIHSIKTFTCTLVQSLAWPHHCVWVGALLVCAGLLQTSSTCGSM